MKGTARQALHQLHTTHGHLTADLVLEEAGHETSPLHSHFEWDDTEAAHRYRLNQARGLIRSFRVTYRDDQTAKSTVRAYVSVQSDNGPVYRATEDVLTDEFAHRLLVQQLQRDLKALERKYGHLQEYRNLLLAVAESA